MGKANFEVTISFVNLNFILEPCLRYLLFNQENGRGQTEIEAQPILYLPPLQNNITLFYFLHKSVLNRLVYKR